MCKKSFFVAMIFVFIFSFILGTVPGNAAEPIKIGFLGPYVGVWTKYGDDLRNGFTLAIEEAGNKAAGRDITFLNEDTEGKPAVGLTKVRKYVEKDQVHILAGLISSGVAYAVKDYVVSNKMPLIICNAGAKQLTQKQRSPYVFRVSFANGQQDSAGGWYAYAKRGDRKYVMIGSDYSAGKEKGGGFSDTFKKLGGEILEEIWVPLGTTDYAPFIAKIGRYVGKADALWTFVTAADAIRFVNQYQEYGLKEKLPIFGEGGITDMANIPSQKDAAVGIEGYMHYWETLDNPENKAFVKAFKEKYGYIPGLLCQQGYLGGKVILRALEAIKGNIEDKEAFLQALKVVKFAAPQGPFRFDDHQNVIENVYISRVEKRNGEYMNTVIHTIPDVGQYWEPPK